jgi:predicted transcriptional regulator
MEDNNFEMFPVINTEKKFMGIVDRSRLTASLILGVATDLNRK